MTEDVAYQRAKRQVAALRAFYLHLAVYVLVNVLLFLISIITSPGSLWFYWPLGWGIAIVAHAVSVFGFGTRGWLGQDWEERRVRELMDKEKKP